MTSRRAGAFEKLITNRRIGAEDVGSVLLVVLRVTDDKRASVSIEFADPPRKSGTRKIRK